MDAAVAHCPYPTVVRCQFDDEDDDDDVVSTFLADDGTEEAAQNGIACMPMPPRGIVGEDLICRVNTNHLNSKVYDIRTHF